MIGQLSLSALAALAVVNGSPLERRQATSAVSSAVASAVSSVASSAESAATSAASGATSLASAASSTVAGATSTVAGATSTAAAATSTGAANGTVTGNQTYSNFPCPAGYLLTYVQQNATVPIPITNVTSGLGEWASSPIFPNVTMPVGGSTPGATHTLNIAGISIDEVLVNATSNDTSGYLSLVWNLTNGPIMAPGVSVSNWTAQLNVYDPDFESTQMIGNTTVADAFVNFCASDQAAGAALLNSVLQLYLGNAAMALSGNATAAASTTAAAAGTGAMSTAASAASGASSTAASAASAATSTAAAAGSSVASSASSAAASATSAASGALASATAAASGAVASATSAAAGAASAVSTAA